MDKDTLDYLAKIATVRSHINTVANAPRDSIDKNTVRGLLSKGPELDRLFASVLLSGEVVSSSSTSSEGANLEDFDYEAKLAAAKLEAASSQSGVIPKTASSRAKKASKKTSKKATKKSAKKPVIKKVSEDV